MNEGFHRRHLQPSVVCSSPVGSTAHSFSSLAIGAIDLQLCDFDGSFVSIAEGRDISCKCGLVDLEIECCNLVKETKVMNIHCSDDCVAFKLVLTEILLVRGCLRVCTNREFRRAD